jgi:hypothetical protein
VVFDLRTVKQDAVEPPQRMWPLSSLVGDPEKAIRDAAVKVERTYTMPDAITIQWSRMRPWRFGTTPAR